MLKHFALLALLMAARAVSAQSDPRWLQVRTEHFTVMTDGSERQARHTAGQLERMHNVFAKLLPAAADDPGSRIVVLAFRDRKGFQSVEPAAYLTRNSLDLAGLFMGGQDRSYILLRMDTEGEHPYATVYHEYTHYMLRHAESLPIWLNEGWAQFYQNTDILDDSVRLGQPDPNSILFLRQQRLLPLETLFLVDHTSPYYHEENKGNVFYAESWALTHFLTQEDFGKPTSRLQTYAQFLMQGESAVAAAQHAFGDLGKLQADLATYINHGDYKLFSMPLQNSVDEKALVVDPLPAATADAMRADVLAETGRTDDAEALIARVLAEDPANMQAHESMGTLKLREGRMSDASKWYGEAVALHSENFLTYYYFGTLLLRSGANAPESAGVSLRRAMVLNPRFAPAAEALAQFDVSHEEELDEARDMSLRAVSLDPKNVRYRMTAAEVRVARKEVSSAVQVLQAALKISRTPEERSRVQARLEEVTSYQQQAAQIEASRVEGSAEMTAEAHLSRPPTAEAHASGALVSRPEKLITPDHSFPASPANGPRHTVSGKLSSVDCFYPKRLVLKVENATKPLSLYSNDMYAISFTAGNFTPASVLNPCRDFEGLTAEVVYTAVDDPSVQGQIVSMELSR